MSDLLGDAEFAALASYLADEAGLVFDASRRPGLSAVVADRMAATSIEDVGRYLAFVRGHDEAAVSERQALLDDVTIQETHFYRNGAQVDALRSVLLPDLMRQAAAEGRDLRVWSAGCSTGEEPYTLSMLVHEVAQRDRLDVRAQVLGTDVSQAALDFAAAATYAGRTVDLAERGALDRWFEGPLGPGPCGSPSYRVAEPVRAAVSLQRHNLVTDEPPLCDGEADLIVCRNVTIYFARDTTQALVERFHRVLRPGGYLMLGHAETLWRVTDAFTLVPVGEAFVYRKDEPVVPGAADTDAVLPALTVLAGVDVPVDGSPRRAADPLLSAAWRKVELANRPHVPDTTAGAAGPGAAEPVGSDGVQLLEAARAAAHTGRYAEAADLAGQALRADPLLADAYVVRGQAWSTLGDDESALDVLRKAVYLEPAAGHAHFLLAGALARLGRPAAAARSFRAAAATLHRVPPAVVDALLDGRDVAELVALCEQLADASERAAAAGSTTGRSTA